MTATTSIIITTKNRRDELRRAVQSAVEQVGCTEVLIFDDGSSDGTSELIEREFPTVRLKRVEQSLGIVSARNRVTSITPTMFPSFPRTWANAASSAGAGSCARRA